MSNCTKCNTPLEEGTVFCMGCGTKVEETVSQPPQAEVIYCSSCGQQTSTEFAFCQKCGKSLSNDQQAESNVISQNNISASVPVSSSAKKSKLPIMIIGGVLAIAVIITAIIINPFKSTKSVQSIAYIKDKNISLTFINSIAPFEITEKLMGGDFGAYADIGSLLSLFLKCSEDERYLLYPDRLDEIDRLTLYYKDLKSKNPAIKIDSDIEAAFSHSYSTYGISADGKRVIYLKGDESNLYFHNLKDKEKIESNVDIFYFDNNISKVLYEKDDAIYIKDIAGKKEKEKIASEATIAGFSDNFSKIYYLKDGSLYIKDGNKDGEKIASDVDYLYAKYDSGNLYYIKEDDTEVLLSDYVTDDLKNSDAKITEPKISDYETYTPDGFWGYTTTDYDAYYEARDKYKEKQSRDTLRTNLSSQKITLSNDTLYFYDGSKEIAISDGIDTVLICSSDKPLIAYKKYNKSEVPKVKLSEISSVSEVQSLVRAAQSSSSEIYAACKEKESIIEQEKAVSFGLNYSSAKLYFIDDKSSESNSGALMEVSFSADKASKPIKVDDDVYSYGFKKASDEYYYFKDVKNSAGDIYENKKLLASDVAPWSVTSIKGSSDLVYITDYSTKGRSGTLNILKSSKPTKIADDVHSFYAISNSSIVYLNDFSTDREKGDLFLYKGSSKPVRVDTDVNCIIAMNYRSYYGGDCDDYYFDYYDDYDDYYYDDYYY